jgi:hypothetical protein
MMDFQTWLTERGIDCQTLTPELQTALQSQYEADSQRLAPPAEKLVASADCPAKVFRLPIQLTLFDCSEQYR